ncbi:MAG: phenylalanine--tRNA ligase subunit beta, partial [Lactobacillus sp.]|nr:phenylalanine--tRNA ligase subunit beta [Lactobacillus sp.]
VGKDAGLHPGYQAEMSVNGKTVGYVGKLHPVVADAFGLGDNVYLYEINLTDLLNNMTVSNKYSVLNKFPAVERDLALVVDMNVTHKQIMNIISRFSMIKSAVLFDQYTGAQIGVGKKSLAYSLTFQADSTLKDSQVDGVVDALTKTLATELDASVRGM